MKVAMLKFSIDEINYLREHLFSTDPKLQSKFHQFLGNIGYRTNEYYK